MDSIESIQHESSCHLGSDPRWLFSAKLTAWAVFVGYNGGFVGDFVALDGLDFVMVFDLVVVGCGMVFVICPYVLLQGLESPLYVGLLSLVIPNYKKKIKKKFY